MILSLGYEKMASSYIIKDEDILLFVLSEELFRNYRIMGMSLFTLKTNRFFHTLIWKTGGSSTSDRNFMSFHAEENINWNRESERRLLFFHNDRGNGIHFGRKLQNLDCGWLFRNDNHEIITPSMEKEKNV